MVTTNDIHKYFEDTHVLKGISANFHRGKTNLIIGQSGYGKTVFLKCLIGLFEPTKGEIFYDNINSNDFSSIAEKNEFRKNIGVVFQGSALFDFMNVEENIMFPLKMLSNTPKKEMLDSVNTLLKRVGLSEANKKMPSEISGGMKRRVAIARAIILNPSYLFCDEPNSGLDPYMSTIIDNLIRDITIEYNITTIINTHDINSMFSIGENILLIKNGKKAWEGDNKSILNSDNQDINEFIDSSSSFKKLRNI